MYRRFSERLQGEHVEPVIQRESINKALNNSIWNVIFRDFLEVINSGDFYLNENSILKRFFSDLYFEFFKLPLDSLSSLSGEQLKWFRSVYNDSSWAETYDIIEYLVYWSGKRPVRGLSGIQDKFNLVLERESSAYRLVDGCVVEITSQQEIESISSALNVGGRFSSVQEHLSQAMQLMSDRTNPDFRNSIKESISSVESLSAILTGEKGTLGQLLKRLEQHKTLPGSIKSAYSALYGYTSDANGIRHALLEKSDLSLADARYMLVVCSAFVNYVIDVAGE